MLWVPSCRDDIPRSMRVITNSIQQTCFNIQYCVSDIVVCLVGIDKSKTVPPEPSGEMPPDHIAKPKVVLGVHRYV